MRMCMCSFIFVPALSAYVYLFFTVKGRGAIRMLGKCIFDIATFKTTFVIMFGFGACKISGKDVVMHLCLFIGANGTQIVNKTVGFKLSFAVRMLNFCTVVIAAVEQAVLPVIVFILTIFFFVFMLVSYLFKKANGTCVFCVSVS